MSSQHPNKHHFQIMKNIIKENLYDMNQQPK